MKVQIFSLKKELKYYKPSLSKDHMKSNSSIEHINIEIQYIYKKIYSRNNPKLYSNKKKNPKLLTANISQRTYISLEQLMH